MNRRILREAFDGAVQIILSLIELADPEICPAKLSRYAPLFGSISTACRSA